MRAVEDGPPSLPDMKPQVEMHRAQRSDYGVESLLVGVEEYVKSARMTFHPYLFRHFHGVSVEMRRPGDAPDGGIGHSESLHQHVAVNMAGEKLHSQQRACKRISGMNDSNIEKAVANRGIRSNIGIVAILRCIAHCNKEGLYIQRASGDGDLVVGGLEF